MLMKKALLFCFIALLISLNAVSQENYPGQVCESAIQITSIPYFTNDTTGNYGDDYNGSPGSSGCGTQSPYLNGDDVVYAFTATDNIPVTITMTPTSQWSGIFVYNSCANIGVSCVAGVGNINSTPRIIVLPVTAGQTYYIVISTWGTTTVTQSVGYNLTVVKNTCTNFSASFSVVPNCANGSQFFASANITSMGTATSIVATSNQGGVSQTISTLGAIQFGPYPNGTNVTLNLQNSSDPNCFRISPNLTQQFCPATNNLCTGAIPITCGSVEMQTTVGATTTGAPTFTCGTGPGSGGLWYTYTGTGDVATFSLCGSAYDTRIQVFTGSCGTFTCVSGNNDSCNTQSEVSIISALGTVYYVYVYGSTGSQGVFTLTTSCVPVPTAPVNDNCQTATIVPVNNGLNCNLISSGTIYGATASVHSNTCEGTPNDDVWYQFVATQTNYYIELKNISGSTTNLDYAVFTSTNASNPCANLTLAYCSAVDLSYDQNFIPGQTYFIRVYSNGNVILQDTNFDLCVSLSPPPPANDECVTAVALAVNPNTICSVLTSGTITSATQSPQANTCVGIANDDVWYQFTATYQEHMISLLNIVGTTTNLNHAVYTSTNASNPCSDLTLLYCSDPNNSYNDTFVVGQTYYIRVFSALNTPGATANFDICIVLPSPPLHVSTTEYTVPELIDEILFDEDCSTVSNITWSTGSNFNSTNGIGYFEKNGSDFPFQKGIVMSTGNVLNVPGYNLTTLSDGSSSWGGDADLETIISAATGQTLNAYNASKIEFNFIPQHNFISFDFIFASEEYGGFQCGVFDAFAFLLTDVASGITTNLAIVPGTSLPISVLTIRNQTYNTNCSSANPTYFNKYYGIAGSSIYSAPINFNGVTHPMTATSLVIPNNLYKIKLVIADRNDTILDAAIFLEGGSFALNNLCQSVIKLEAFVDSNNNGIKEPTELAYTQGTFNYTVNNSTETSVNYSPSGVLFIPVENETDSFDFSYQVYPEMASYFNCTTLHSDIVLIPAGNNTYYFPINNTLPYNDVEVSLTATAGPNPGFTYSNKIKYKNNGLTPASGTLTYVKDPALSITTISQTGTVANANGFTYAYTNLLPNETRTITIGLQTPTIPTVALGDLLTNTVSSATTGDINATNNAAELTQTVIGSYDPNDKMEAQGSEILFSSFGADDYLYYTIRFQNTGTANAQTVIITDLLSADLDEQSIRMISASHDYTMNRMGNDVEWTFEAINLVPTIVSEAGSQGYVHFKIKPKPGYMVGDIIPNTAQIYFDFNAPIITNTFETEFVATLGVADFTTDNLIVYPNPATNQVSISVQNSADAIAEIRLTDMLGKVVFQQKGTHTQTTIDLSGLSKGVYMLEVQTENKFSVVKKLVKN
jgi:uncharacterized repeat protein (TIGR01451 family)